MYVSILKLAQNIENKSIDFFVKCKDFMAELLLLSQSNTGHENFRSNTNKAKDKKVGI